MTLKELLTNVLSSVEEIPLIEVKGLQSNSNKVTAGDVFFALIGIKADGRKFIDVAIKNGAIAVLRERVEGDEFIIWVDQVPIIAINNLSQLISFIAGEFYHHPSQNMQMIGITGTSGKTSCSHLLAHALRELGTPSGVIGTLGYGMIDSKLNHEDLHTTPDPISLQANLAELYAKGAKAVTMEVSSHALKQHRARNIKFDIGVFTNLTREHLDYHPDMADYGASKRLLFTMPSMRYGIFNLDDEFGAQCAVGFHDKLKIIGYGWQVKNKYNFPVVSAEKVDFNSTGMHIKVNTPQGAGEFDTILLSRVNVYNLLVVIASLLALEYPLKDILLVMPKLPRIKGRMQACGGGDKPLVIVDFAHKPDALEQVLSSIREHCHGKLVCVFGCGGDRDVGKRPIMGEIAERLADKVIISDDNVRTENPDKIINDIMRGIKNPRNVVIERDRKLAMEKAILEAEPNDVVVVAGKGDEDYQLIGEQRIPYIGDAAMVEKILAQYKNND